MMSRRKINPAEILRDEERSAELQGKKLAAKPILPNRRSHYDYVGDCWMQFLRFLSIGLLRWRQRLGDPLPPLQEALTLARRAAALWAVGGQLTDSEVPDNKLYTQEGYYWPDLPKRPEYVHFRFGTAALLALTVDKQFDPALSQAIPPLAVWCDDPDLPLRTFFSHNYPDAGLHEALRTGKTPAGWDEMLRGALEPALPAKAQSYRCYMDIVLRSASGERGAALAAVERADRLFDQRSRDTGSLQFDYWEGAGGSNSLCVDFHLAAILSHCFSGHEEVLGEINSIHRWQP